MPHKEYKTAEKLLEAIYAGNNIANKSKRNKELQEKISLKAHYSLILT